MPQFVRDGVSKEYGFCARSFRIERRGNPFAEHGCICRIFRDNNSKTYRIAIYKITGRPRHNTQNESILVHGPTSLGVARLDNRRRASEPKQPDARIPEDPRCGI